MDRVQADFLKGSLWVGAAALCVRCLFGLPETLYELFGIVGEAISIATIVMILYERWLWKLNKFEELPRISGKYSAYLQYESDTGIKSKKIEMIIKQTLLTTSIKILTNEITSNSITSKFVFENGEYVLYYTYITNPKSKFSKDNPIQYGTCRMSQTNEGLFSGIYWTTRQTKGDINMKKKES